MLPKGFRYGGHRMSKTILFHGLSEEEVAILKARGNYVIRADTHEALLRQFEVLSGEIAVVVAYKNSVDDKKSERVLLGGELTLNFNRQTICYKGKEVNLARSEFLIFESLTRRPGMVFTRNQLLDVLGTEDNVDRTIDTHMKRIRKKLDSLQKGLRGLLRTRHGLGYLYREEGLLQREPALAAE